MRTLFSIVIVILFSFSFCKQKKHSSSSKKESGINDSFQFKANTAYIREFERKDSGDYLIICEWNGKQLLSYSHSTPSEFIRTEDLFGDEMIEIIIDECIACESLGSLFILYFDTAKGHFQKLKALNYYPASFTDYLIAICIMTFLHTIQVDKNQTYLSLAEILV